MQYIYEEMCKICVKITHWRNAMDAKKRSATVRLSLDMSPEANDLLERLALDNGTTKSQILRRAVALYHAAYEAKVSGKSVGVLDKDRNIVTEFVGL